VTNRGEVGVAATLWLDHWFESGSLMFFIKILSNDESFLTKITILNRARFA